MAGRNWGRVLLVVLLAVLAGVAWASSEDLLVNGNFETVQDWLPVGWDLADGCALATPAHSGGHALRAVNTSGEWVVATQYLLLSGARVQELGVSGWVRRQDVHRGEKDDDAALVQVGFYDETGGETGDWVTVGAWTGTGDWTHFAGTVPVPATAARIALLVGLQNCTGVAWWDDLRVVATKFTPPAPRRTTSVRTDTRGWYKFQPGEDDYRTPTATDVSWLLDPPAGKHGLLTTRPDGHLYFSDGTRARFWGVDFVAPAPYCSHADAEKIAARLAKYGINLVRLHHLDADWSDPNIFDPQANDTQHLSAVSVDKLDYLLAQFKKHGIYVYLDFLVNRKFKPGDQVRDSDDIDSGAKIVAHFDPRIKALEKKYMAQVMTHRNPYTGLRWAEDPVIAMMEVINEDSLFYEPWYDRVPPSYMTELRALCRESNPKADPAKMPFDEPTLRALYKIQTGYFLEMKQWLRGLGVKVPITGSNHWENMTPDIYSNSQLDYIDRHYYWDHPEGGYGGTIPFEDRPLVRNPWEDGLVQQLAKAKVAGKPLVVTEWATCWPNEYMEEGPLIAAAYADLQDWDAVVRFDFTGTQWDDEMSDNFDMGNKPSVMAQWPAAALLFYRRDLAPAAQVIHTALSEGDIFAGREIGAQAPDWETFTERCETELGAASSSPELAQPAAPGVLDAGALKWDWQQGLVTVDTQRTMALTGWAGRRGQVRLAGGTVEAQTPFAALWVTSLDGRPLGEARRVLITATARAENTGTVYEGGKGALTSDGHDPILLEPVQATVYIRRDPGAARLRCWALSATGRRLREVTPEVAAGVESVRLGDDAFWWELGTE